MQTLRILHAEDDPAILVTVAALLERHVPGCPVDAAIENVTTFADFITKAFEPWDAILLDLTFPDSKPEDTYTWVENNHTNCAAIIIVTGSDNDAIFKRAFTSGALRFVLKTEMKQRPRHLLLEIYECSLTKQAIRQHYVPKT